MTDFTKLPQSEWHKVTTRDGRKVRILCVDGPTQWPITVLVKGEPAPQAYSAGGMRIGSCAPYAGNISDLILPPEPRMMWLRVYDSGSSRQIESHQATRRGPDIDWTDFRITITGDEPKIERVD